MKEPSPLTASRFVEELLGQGRYTFTREEAAGRLGTSAAATYMSLHRLAKARWLVMPRSGFYVIVDPQHRVAGSLPPEWFIHDLMKDMARPYYVGLLSAAQLHGAAHQQPQKFQIVIPRRTVRPIRAGNVLIEFHGKGPFNHSQTQEIKTPTGSLKVSTPETTAWDLVRYFKAAEDWRMSPRCFRSWPKTRWKRFRAIVKRHDDKLVAQRLGYLLDKVGRRDLSSLVDWVQKARCGLIRERGLPGLPESRKWHSMINARMEVEA